MDIAEHSNMREARLALTCLIKAVDEACTTGRLEQIEHSILHGEEALTALKSMRRAMLHEKEMRLHPLDLTNVPEDK